MESKASLCVSVVSGDHSVFGPDWIQVDIDRNLIDVLVQVAGTQVLGQQVQVIISKDSCFTESALFQLSASVGLLEKSGNHHVNFLLKQNLLTSNYYLASQSKDSPTVSRCIAERDIDLTKSGLFSKELVGVHSNLTSLYGKDNAFSLSSKLNLSSKTDAVDTAIKLTGRSSLGLESWVHWYKEKTLPLADKVEKSNELAFTSTSLESISPTNGTSTWPQTPTYRCSNEYELKNHGFASHGEHSSDCINKEKAEKIKHPARTPSPSICHKPTSESYSGTKNDIAGKKDQKVHRAVSQTDETNSVETEKSGQNADRTPSIRECTSTNSCGACIWCRHMKRVKASKDTSSHTNQVQTRHIRAEMDQSDTESEVSLQGQLIRGTKKMVFSERGSMKATKQSKEKGISCPMSTRRKDNLKVKSLLETSERGSTASYLKSKASSHPLSSKRRSSSCLPSALSTVNNIGNNLERKGSRRSARSSSATPRISVRRDRSSAVNVSGRITPSTRTLRKKLPKNMNEEESCTEQCKDSIKKGCSVESFDADTNVEKNNEKHDVIDCSDKSNEENLHFLIDSIEREPESKKQTIILQLSPTKSKAPTTLFISSCSSSDSSPIKKQDKAIVQNITLKSMEEKKKEESKGSDSHFKLSIKSGVKKCDGMEVREEKKPKNKEERKFFWPLFEKNQMKPRNTLPSKFNTTSNEFSSSFFWVDCKDGESASNNEILCPKKCSSPDKRPSKLFEEGTLLSSLLSSGNDDSLLPKSTDQSVPELSSKASNEWHAEESCKSDLELMNGTSSCESPVRNSAVIFLSQTSKATSANRTFTLDDMIIERGEKLQEIHQRKSSNQAVDSSLTVSKVTASKGLSSPVTDPCQFVGAQERLKERDGSCLDVMSISAAEKSEGEVCTTKLPETLQETKRRDSNEKPAHNGKVEPETQTTRKTWNKQCGLMDQLLLASLYAFSWELRGAAESVSNKTRRLFERWPITPEVSKEVSPAAEGEPSLVHQSPCQLVQDFHGSQKDVAGVFRNLRKVEVRLKTMEKAIETMMKERTEDKSEEKKRKDESFFARLPSLLRARSFNWRDFKLEAKKSSWKSSNNVANLDDSISESDDNA